MSEKQVLLYRFERFFEKTDGCWNWNGARMRTGYDYGKFGYLRRWALAHRMSLYLYKNIPIKKKYEANHICDTPSCVNPKHILVGTHSSNMQDKLSKGRDQNQKKTHCPKGHEYSLENTYRYKNGRTCKICRRVAGLKYNTKRGNRCKAKRNSQKELE